MGNIPGNDFKFGPVVQEIVFKEYVYGRGSTDAR